MSVRITTNQNAVTVADADRSITIINNREPNRIDIVQSDSNVVYVATLGPQGPAGSGGGGTTDISALNSFSGSILAFTQSIQTQVNGLSNATSSYVLNSITSSMLQPYVLTSATSSMIVSGALTASYYREADPVFTAVSGTYALTSSFNSFTASYNTGSFTGSFTGRLIGTASLAQTASYVLSSNIDGPSGPGTVNYASNAGSADAIADPLTQDVQIRGLLSNRILLSDLDTIVASVPTSTGNVVEGTPGTGLSIGSLCYLDYNTPAWELVNQTNNSATKLLAICTNDNTGYFLLDGKITLDSSYIGGTLQVGAPIYLSGSGQFTANVASLTTGYVRLVGHLLHRTGANYILNFRPDHTWIEL